MPHCSIEYSASLDTQVDFDALCALILKTAMASGLFEAGAPRVRAFRAEYYAIADQLPENGFIDMVLRIGVGRSAGEKQAVGNAIFAAVSDQLAPLFGTPHFALSLELREIDPVLSWKKNVIHPRLRAN